MVVGAGLALWVTGRGDDRAPAALPSVAPNSGTAPPPSAVRPTGEPLRLVRGGRVVDGLHVGFPRSTAGAVSAAVEFWTQLGSTLDPDRARSIARRIAVRSWKTAGEELAAGTVSTRRQLALPAAGDVPPGTSVSLGPVAYQLRDPGEDRVTVLVLAYLITTTPTVGTQSRIGVFPAPLRWDDGDWRIERAQGRSDYRGLQAQPGSPEAVAAGWLDFVS
ncbi:hypothetical protein [Spirilliplanes yamanashiensis]|uniref:hypothetical protein n=1 Tax=Spirilliplanes yamanashiensis TaxID=42233 RepID=UPI00194F962F|nr:hypothetical protein [Spirilliplanes yamanashiensis]MDP9818505.1 hypothetical protein [Spirilliplanes yamanashiensis]